MEAGYSPIDFFKLKNILRVIVKRSKLFLKNILLEKLLLEKIYYF